MPHNNLSAPLPIHAPIPGTQSTIGSFWQWAFSDVLTNTTRGVFAEYLVGLALGVVDQTRVEWDAADLRFNDLLIEVKSVAYLQSWEQDKLSDIRFDIAPKISWHAESNSYDKEQCRSANYYVFCLFKEKDEKKANVLDVEQWEFYVAATKLLDKKFGGQKSIGLNGIKKFSDAISWEMLSLERGRLLQK